jgi:WD40 repeat protein
MAATWGLVVNWMLDFAPIVAKWAYSWPREGAQCLDRLHHLEAFQGFSETARDLLRQAQEEPELHIRQQLQQELVAHQRDTQVQVAAYQRATALKLAEANRILEDWPLRLYPSQLLDSQSHCQPRPLKIFLALPDRLNPELSGINLELQVAQGVRQFLQHHYPLQDSQRPSEFIGGAWKSEHRHSEASIKTLFSVLRSEPTLILGSEMAGDRLTVRIAYWGLAGQGYSYQTIAQIPYRQRLVHFAKQRARSWQTLQQQLQAAGEDAKAIAALGSDNQANLALLEQETRWQQQGIETTALELSYQISAADGEDLCQELIRCYCLIAAWVIDLYHLISRDVCPRLPQLLPDLLSPTVDDTLLEVIVTSYRQIYTALTVDRSLWLPDLLLQLAQSLSHLPDPRWAISQVEASVQSWLQVRQVSGQPGPTDWQAALAAVAQTHDRDYLMALRDCWQSLNQPTQVAALERILQTLDQDSGDKNSGEATVVRLNPSRSGSLDLQPLPTMLKHKAAITAIAMNPSGDRLVSGGLDQRIHLWNPQTGEHLRTLSGHTTDISSVALSPDGRYLASSSCRCPKSNVKVWDLGSGKLLHDRLGHKRSTRSVTIDAAGRILCTGGNKIKIWDLASGERLCTLGHTSVASCLAMAPNGQLLASGSSDGKIKLWHPQSGELLRSINTQAGEVQALLITSDGQYVLSASADGALRLWELPLGRRVEKLAAHTGPITSLTMTADSQWVVSGSVDGTAKLWHLPSRKRLVTVADHRAAVNAVAISQTGCTLATGSADGHVRLWRLGDLQGISRLSQKIA